MRAARCGPSAIGGRDDTKASGTGRGRTAVGIELKAGTRLRSAVDACEVVVVKAPGEPVDLRCGGHPFVALDAEVTPQSIEPGFDGGTQLGKRYADDATRARAAVHQGGRGVDLGRRDRARGQGGQGAPGLGLTGADGHTRQGHGQGRRGAPVNIAMLLEMAAEGDPDRVVVGSKSGGLTAAVLLERSRRAGRLLRQERGGGRRLLRPERRHPARGALRCGLRRGAVRADQLSSAGRAAQGDRRARARRPHDRRPRRGVPAARGRGRHRGDQGRVRRSLDDPSLSGGRVRLRRPRVHRCAALHVGDDLGAQGGRAAPPPPGLLHHHQRRVPRVLGRRGPADLRAAVPHRRRGGRAVARSIRAGASCTCRPSTPRSGCARRRPSRSPTPWWCRPCWGASSTRWRRPASGCRRCATCPTAAGGCRSSWSSGRLRDLPQVDLVNAYGLTETSSTIAMLTPDDHREAFASDDPAVRARLGSVGRPLPTLEVEVRGEDDVVVVTGEKGEIWVRGEQVAGEYVGQSVLTEDGWFRTRDAGLVRRARLLVRRRAAGRCHRAGGREHLAGGDRGGAHGTRGRGRGRRDRHPRRRMGRSGGRRGRAARGRGGRRRPSCRTGSGGSCARPRCPGVIDFRDELPYSPTGKLLRRVLRDELAAAAGGGDSA